MRIWIICRVFSDPVTFGLGAVLAQKQKDGQVHPVAYASRTLNPQEKHYGITEMETLAVVWAAKHFRPYLLGHHCTVFTDHSACLALLNSPHPSAKLARWAMCIQELDLDMRHKPGKHNTNADALSQNPGMDLIQECKQTAVSCAVATDQVNDVLNLASNTTSDFLNELNEAAMELHQQQMQKVRKLQQKDASLQLTISYLEDGKLPKRGGGKEAGHGKQNL